MKIKWLIADGTAVRSPDREEHAILRLVLAGRCFAQSVFVVVEPDCDIGNPS